MSTAKIKLYLVSVPIYGEVQTVHVIDFTIRRALGNKTP